MTIDLRTPTPPEHVEDTVSAISQVHAEHYRRVRPAQRTAAVAIAALGRPAFVGVLSVVAGGWIALNLALMAIGHQPPDPPPFAYIS